MIGFGRAMCLDKGHEFKVATPLGYRLNAFVDVDSSRLTGMVGAKFLY
jgi:hypothetical protein